MSNTTENLFEEYLREKHAETYSGTDDNMQNDYEDWLVNLDTEELLEYGNEAMNNAE